MLGKCAQIWDEVKIRKPLVHCISNYVTVNDVANIILASGASPAMCEHPVEVADFACMAQAVYFNLGTLSDEQEVAMLETLKAVAGKGIPVIVDPVACGVISRRKEVLEKLFQAGPITAIKGNTAEIKSLAGIESHARGVDSLDSGEGIEEACRIIARREKTIVAASGEIDLVIDGDRIACIKNGTSLFANITGAGCMLGGVIAACAGAVPGEPWLATVTALCAFTIAGEKAAKASGKNPGTFRGLLFDNLFNLSAEDIRKEARVEWSL